MAARRRAFAPDPSVVGVDFAVVGGVATSRYMPERTTVDIDVLIAPRSLDEARRNLQAAGWREGSNLTPEPGLGLREQAWRRDDQHLDVLWSDAAWARHAIEGARSEGRKIVELGYLVMMKMNAARGVDQGDLTRMLGLASEVSPEAARAILREHRPDLLEDFEQYIAIGKLEADADSGDRDGRP